MYTSEYSPALFLCGNVFQQRLYGKEKKKQYFTENTGGMNLVMFLKIKIQL